MQMNPRMQMAMQIMRNRNNPQQLAMSLLSQQAENNPMLQNLLSLAQEGKSANIEQIARNMLKAQGLDFDKEFKDFTSMLGL